MLASWSVLLVLALAGGVRHSPILVSAAVSLTEALEEIGTEHARQGGGPVSFNFAGSNVLARQILRGAPADVFISADEAQMDLVERAGGCVVGTRADVVSNRLAVVVGAAAPAITGVPQLADASVRRIAIGDPAAVPAGVYARVFLERIGLWPTLEKKIIPTANVRAALNTVANGSADAGFVYVTDARDDARVRVVAVISGSDAPSILYPACVVASSKNKARATAFLSFLRGPAAQQTFERRGFLPPR